MRHRGPDESGVWHDDDVALGFNRLSIIDVENSHQPLPYASDRYRIVFNGEIYNYLELREELARDHGAQFVTDGDTEAIVAAYDVWGPDAVRRLRGMFAFLIWDTHERVLFGARDPFGIKPLYVSAGPHGVAFASEKKACSSWRRASASRPPRPTRPRLQHYLQLQYVPEPRYAAPRASAASSRARASPSPPGEPMSTERYFVPTFDEQPVAGREPACTTEITEVLRDSVAKHMRADVTVGAFLSGGIDSTAIAALAKRAQPRPHHLHDGLRARGLLRGRRRRASRPRRSASRHVVRTSSPPRRSWTRCRSIVWYLDDPVADPALVPAVVRRPRGPQARQGRALRRGRRRAVRRLHDLPGAAVARAVREAARRRCAGSPGRCRRQLPDGMRGKDLLRRGVAPARGALLRQRPHLPRRPARRGAARARPRALARRRHRAALRRLGLLGPGGADAARRPVHLAARRHPGQGRQDDDGQLPRAARAVPRHGGLRGRVAPADRPEGRPRHHEVRAAPGDRAASCRRTC